MELAGLEPATPFSARLRVPIHELFAVALYVFAAVRAVGALLAAMVAKARPSQEELELTGSRTRE
jgi:hypothetical protein